MSNKTNIWARRKARRALVQAVYQWQLSGNSTTSVRADFADTEALKKADVEFFEEVFGLVTSHLGDLDDTFSELLDRPAAQLDHVERALLRLATAEFAHRMDIPYRVVINEYVELAKTFGATDSHKYINGVLDKLAVQLRSIEVEAAARG